MSAVGGGDLPVHGLDLIQLQLHGGLPSEHGDHHADLAAFQVQLLHSAQEGLQGAVGDLDAP